VKGPTLAGTGDELQLTQGGVAGRVPQTALRGKADLRMASQEGWPTAAGPHGPSVGAGAWRLQHRVAPLEHDVLGDAAGRHDGAI